MDCKFTSIVIFDANFSTIRSRYTYRKVITNKEGEYITDKVFT